MSWEGGEKFLDPRNISVVAKNSKPRYTLTKLADRGTLDRNDGEKNQEKWEIHYGELTWMKKTSIMRPYEGLVKRKNTSGEWLTFPLSGARLPVGPSDKYSS